MLTFSVGEWKRKKYIYTKYHTYKKINSNEYKKTTLKYRVAKKKKNNDA